MIETPEVKSQTALRPPPEHADKLWHTVELGGVKLAWIWTGAYWVPGSGTLTPEQASMWTYLGPKE